MGVAPRYLQYLEHLGQTVPVRTLHDAVAATNVIGLRHDVDHDLDAALEMGWWEQRRGCRATYFLLHTAPYWTADPRLEDKALQLQDWGHEIGLHVNVLTEWTAGAIDDAAARLRELLERLRGAGLQVAGVSAHGDRACYQRQFANYWCWRELRPDDPAQRETGRSAEGIVVEDPTYRLSYPSDHRLHREDGSELALWQVGIAEMDLVYDAAHVASERYFTDSGGGWQRSPDPLDEDLASGRHQVLVHPEHWRDERRRSWLVLSTARSGSLWLTETLQRATPLTARHELTLNHRYRYGELVPDKHTAEGFADLARRPSELRSLMVEARLWMDDQAGDYVEANVYLAHALDQIDDVFPDARLLHLHRHPADVVRSLLNRDWYDTPDDDRHPAMAVAGWERMSQVERACWYVRSVNEALLARDLPRVALEDVSADPHRLGEALEAVNMPFYPRLATAGYFERINPARSDHVPRVEDWPAPDRAHLARICGPLLPELGYRTRLADRLVRRLGVLGGMRLAKRRGQAADERVTTLLLDERFRDADSVTVVGAAAEWTDEGLIAVPAGDRHVQILVGCTRWRRCEPQEGWTPTPGDWYRAQLDPGPTATGPFSLFILMYDGDGDLIAQRRLGTIRGPEPLQASFAARADAARFCLGIHASREALPAAVALRRLALRRVEE